jgi:hypothetical protein
MSSTERTGTIMPPSLPDTARMPTSNYVFNTAGFYEELTQRVKSLTPAIERVNDKLRLP